MDIQSKRTKERLKLFKQLALPFNVNIFIKNISKGYQVKGIVTEKGIRDIGYHVELTKESQELLGYSGLFFDDYGVFTNQQDYQRYFEVEQ